MRAFPGVVVSILLALGSPLGAETWRTTDGRSYEGKLSSVHGPFVVVAEKKISRVLSVEVLGDDELRRVADFLAAKPVAAPAWNGSTSKVAKALKGRLSVLRDNKWAEFQPAARPEPEFYLIYFGADWCPPCHAFTPTLVRTYERLKQAAPDAFELVFISSDRSSAEQLKYARHVGMPWPVLKFNHRGLAEPLERWAGSGIPCLVVVTREGEALLHSYRGTEYVGPRDVLEKFEDLLRTINGDGRAAKRAMHRLAVMRHLSTTAQGVAPAKPYLLNLDLARYQTLEASELLATLKLDEKGTVTDVAIEPPLPPVLEHQLVADAGTWLFLPAVRDGIGQPVTVKLPLKLR